MRNTNYLRSVKLLLLFLLVPLYMSAQTSSVRGTLKDATGEPLIGASVIEKGTTNGAITDIDGNYTISVSPNATLDFSYMGFITQSVAVNGRSAIDVVLEEDVKFLDEVVVIGYGAQRKEAVTGSVASINTATLREVPGSNISQSLQGRVAGVEMTQSSTKPGAEMQIRIRGTRSLNASNDPLVVLDGIPFAGTISDIDPNNIKSIDILKDASATAIYGSRGANGVILVTTNKGMAGQKPRVSYNSYVGLKTVFAEYPMMNAEEFIKLRKDAGQYIQNGVDESDDVDTNWQDLLYRNGLVTSQNLAITGGTTGGVYDFGLSYYKDEAVLPGQDYQRFSLRGSVDQSIGKYFRMGIITNNNYSINNGSNLGMYTTLSTTPIANPYNEDGSWKRIVKMTSDEHYVYSKEIVEGLGDAWRDQTKSYGSYNSLYGELQIPGVEGLKYRMNIGLNFRMSNGGSYTGEGVFSSVATTPSTASISNSLTTSWAIENLLTYDRMFGKHQVNVVGMYSAEQTSYNRSYVSALDIPADHFQYFNLGQANGEITVNPDYQGYSVSGLKSWMGRAMYSYDSKYMLSVTFRSDGSSRLAEGHKWHSYPAVSAGWNLKRESFMDNVEFIDMLKIRAGYGQTSNQSVDPYKTLGRLGTRPYNFGDLYTMGYYVTELPNPVLGWEYSITWNYGLDFSLFNGRLRGTAEYYIQNTKDVLLSVGLPSTSGVGSYMANIGETQNKGYEVSLSGTIIDDNNGWTWDVGINLYSNRNKLIALASDQEGGRDEANRWFVGYPINSIYDYEKIGLWQEGDPYLEVLEPGGNVGMIKVKYTGEYDENGKPVRAIGDADRQVMSLEPNFQGGFNTRVAYKDLDLSIVGAFQNGGTLISTLYSNAGYLNMLSGRRNNVKVDYWTPENTDAKYPKPGGIESSNNPKYGGTLGYFDATYLKVRTITLGYNFRNSGWLKRMGVENLRIYGTVQNPFVLFSPYNDESGMDPETNSYGDENQAVTAFNKRFLVIGTNTPTTRNYLFGVNLTF